MDISSINSFINNEIQIKIIYTIGIFLFSFLFKFIIIKTTWQKTKQIQIRFVIRRILNISITVFIAFSLITVWVKNFDQIGTFLGLFSAGIAISMKDLLVNIVGWLFIIARRPFIVGDRIQLGENSGDVIDISIFQTTILEIGNWIESDQSTGRILHFPNSLVFLKPLANSTKAFEYIWNEMKILVTFESDWLKAKEVIQNIITKKASDTIKEARKQIENASQKYLIHYKNLTPMIYTSVKDSGVLLTIRYLCKVRERRYSEHLLWEDILNAFKEHDNIELAYPTQRFFNRSNGR